MRRPGSARASFASWLPRLRGAAFALALAVGAAPAASGTQLVFLDFDSATAGGDHVYTRSERDAVQAIMEGHWAPFDYAFTQVAPGGSASTVRFNDGAAFGLADAVDFRNLDPTDAATVNVNDPSFTTSAEIVGASANVASHVLGDLAGLRHGDAFGPIGSGIADPPGPSTSYLPAYPGPVAAFETAGHLMEGAGLQTFAQLAGPLTFSERSAVKLAFNEGGSVVAEQAGAHGSLATAQVYEGGRWLSHGYLAQLGTGMPFAIAAQRAHPDRRVICVMGDGAVGFNFAEFDTMVRHDLPVVVVVNNDQQWGMSAHGQDLIYGEGNRVVTDLAATRYDLAAAGFGCHGEHVVEPGELLPALLRALASGKPACVNVMTDPSVISLVTLALVGGASEAGLTGESKELRYLP